MILKNNMLKFSSLCIMGAVAIVVNQMMPNTIASKSATDSVAVADSGLTVNNISDDSGTNVIIGGSTVSNTSSTIEKVSEEKSDETTEVIDDEAVPAEENPEATVEPTEEPEEDPLAIPGINYKDYIDMSKYTDLGICNVSTYLNLRKGAGTSYDIVAKMPPKAGCTIHEEVTDEEGSVWCKVTSGEITGYVLKEYLYVGQEALDNVASAGRLVITVTTDVLNVRTEATTDSNILYQINKGEKLDIAAVTDGWIEVNVDIGDQTGFVSSDYVEITFELDTAIDVDEVLVGVSEERVQIISYAKQFLGNPYVYGGTNLYTGIDCSAYVRAIYAQFGYSLHRTSREQAANDGTIVSEAELQPADLVFYATNGTVTHVAMYIGNGKIIHASNKRDGIKISNMKYTTPYRYRSILND